MNRLQKKCLIASVATHGLLLTLLFVGPAFLARQDKTPPAQILTMISSRVVDDAPSSDAVSAPRASQPPPAPPTAPAVVPAAPTPPAPPHPAPTPAVKPTPPEIPKLEKNGPEFKRVTPVATEPTKEFTPVIHPPPAPKKGKPTDSNAADDENRRIIEAQLRNRIKALTTALAGDNSVQIGPVGDRGEAVSNYRDVVYSIYTAAWQPPASITDNSATVTARVTIARNGQVTHHEITKPSGNPAMDKSIENTLSTVTFIQEFPAGSKDSERSYSIKFDISAKRSLE